MTYMLENQGEAQRLEQQSSYPKYDFRRELEGLTLHAGDRLLDAGCGSGIVCRHLAESQPSAEIVGCDFSRERLETAAKFAEHLGNVEFDHQQLDQLSYADNSFDHIVCRYVIEHIPEAVRAQVFAELARVLRPGGSLYMVDWDGPLYNIFPQTPLVEHTLKMFEAQASVDLYIGRKIPSCMMAAGLENPQWRIETIEAYGETLNHEKELLPPKLDSIHAFVTSLLQSPELADRFRDQYLQQLDEPGTVLFYNKFIVKGTKPSHA